MDIKEIEYKNRNDFKAVFVCEHCGHEFKEWGYDDDNYWNNVMPNALCPKCGKNSNNENEEQLKNRLGRIYRI